MKIEDVVRNNETRFTRLPAILQFAEQSAFNEVYGFAGSQGVTVLEGQRLVPVGKPSKTVYIFMHPSSTLQLLPMPQALASAGMHVICAASRYPKQDSALIMEKVAIDLGVWIRWAKESCGYERVILVGWSGGGSLSLFYQAEAEHPTITHTPAGDPVNLVDAGLIPADGVIFIAAHKSRAELLTEFLDPSIRNELNPDDRDLDLSIYDDDCPHKPPFDAAFIVRFREAQIARNHRITVRCQEQLEKFKKARSAEVERGFVVYRTMCDPRWIDSTIEPNDRKPNWSYLGEPRIANVIPAGLARYASLRSWLSQWSYNCSNVTVPKTAPRIRKTPVFQIENSADDAVPASHNAAVRDALGTSDKEYLIIKGATHYYVGQPDLLKQCIDAVYDWSMRKGLLTS